MNYRSIGGKEAEALVARHVEKQGFAVIARNYRKPYGEIDLIAQSSSLILFIEVKMRRTDVVPLQALVTYSKQQKISKVAREFISKNDSLCQDKVLRFDVALVSLSDESITYIPDAFQTGG